MSLKINVVANYTGVLLTTFMTFFVVPFYLDWLGPESYGLVGVATLLQSWIMLISAGLAPVAGRMAATAKAGGESWDKAVRFFRTVDWYIAIIGAIVFLFVYLFKNWFTTNWLKVKDLDFDTVALCVLLLCLMCIVRLATSVTRGIVINLEAQVWQNIHLVVFSTLRFAASLPIVYYYREPTYLFIWWCLVAVLEYFSIQYKVIKLSPVKMPFLVIDNTLIKEHGKMAATLGFTSLVWVLITQLDKVVLSGVLPLEEYGYYSVATLLSGGILILCQPISQAFQPRITAQYAVSGIQGVNDTFIQCSFLTILFILPVAVMFFYFPKEILFVWTGDYKVGDSANQVLMGYSLGNTFVALTGLLYLLQVAIGHVKYHFYGNVLFALVLTPLVPLAALYYGANGAAWLWALVNAILFFAWSSFVLNKLSPTITFNWLFKITSRPMVITFIVVGVIRLLVNTDQMQRGFTFFVLAIISTCCFLCLGLFVKLNINKKIKDF